LDNAAPARLESNEGASVPNLSGLTLASIVPKANVIPDGEFAMATYLLERSLYGAMAAVLIVPELATFFVFVGFALGLAMIAGSSAWEFFTAKEQPAVAGVLIES
jgi:hypothetical protein